MQYLFVITYGRSGSTVLLNLLNGIEGYTIRGENCGIVSHLAKTVRLLRDEQALPHAKATHPSAPWYGILDPDADQWGQRLADGFTAEFLRPTPETRVLGFKEIRYSPDEISDAAYEDTIAFLARYFPDARFIFNTRDWSEVVESGWWRYYPNVREVGTLVRKSDVRFRQSVDQLGDRAFLIDHSDFAGNPNGFRPLLEWLGEEMPQAELERITSHRLKHMQLAHEDRGKLLRLRRKLSMALARASFRVPERRASGS